MTAEDEPEVREWAEEYADSVEYSVFGWMKWEHLENRRNCHIVYRLSINDPDHAGDNEMGDRTLACFLCSDYYFSTYSIGTVDADYRPNLTSKISISEFLGQWTYLYFGYSNTLRTAHIFVTFP